MANNVNVKKLEADLWESADLLRAGSKLTSNQYCMPVLGLIFLRYAYSRFKLVEQEILKDRPVRGGRVLPVEQSDFAEKSALFLPKEAQYNYLVNLPANIPEQGLTGIEGNPLNSLGEVVNNAMELVEQQSEQLQGVLPKDYTIFSDELLGELLRIFNNDALDDVGGDVIGRIYEYFLNKFAKNVAQDDGVFFTPKSLVKMIVNVLEPAHGVLLDPACGSGGMFVQTGDFVNHAGMIANNTMTFYGQEKVEYNAKLCLMNMAVHGLTGVIKSGDEANTFYQDAHNLNGCCDYVMANPPFNLKKWREENELIGDYRWSGYCGKQNAPRVSNANYAWILHMISKLDVNHGIAGFLLANGALGDMDDYEIRKNILLKDKVEAIIVLPRDMFYTTDISVTLWIINMNKRAGTVNGRKVRDRQHEVLFMDLRTWDNNIEEITIDKGKKKKKTVLTDSQIAKIKEVYNNWQSPDRTLYKDVPEFCKSVKINESDLTEEEKANGVITIEKQNYALMPSKYIEFIDHDLDIDYKAEMQRIQSEMKEISRQERESQELLSAAFKGIGYDID